MYQRQEFKDREAKNPNKRRIIVLEQNANEIIANIEPVAEEITEEGTPFNADLMEKFQESIIQSETDSSEALRKANEAIDAVQNGQGTSVYVNGEFVPNFNADEKLDVNQYNIDKELEKNSFEAILQRVAALENSPIMTKIKYDSESDTFTI